MSTTPNAEKPFDHVNFIMDFESGQMKEEAVIAGFQELINSGLAWQLQGTYGRTANQLIAAGHCTRPAQKEQAVGKSEKVGPFEKVSRDEIREFGDQKFRIVLYGAYNAMGLIGSEFNGVAVLWENQRQVVCDNLCKIDSGYFGPSKEQIAFFDNMMKCDVAEFESIVNNSDRARIQLELPRPADSSPAPLRPRPSR